MGATEIWVTDELLRSSTESEILFNKIFLKMLMEDEEIQLDVKNIV